jgi:hypothetical protein
VRTVRAYGAGGRRPDVSGSDVHLGQMRGHMLQAIKRRRVQEAGELARYLTEPVASAGVDVHHRWRQHAGRHPKLALIVHDDLAILRSWRK